MRDILDKAVPEFEGARPSIVAIAKALGVSRQSIHNWMRDGIIPADSAFRLLNVADGGITLEDIKPYVSEMDG